MLWTAARPKHAAQPRPVGSGGFGSPLLKKFPPTAGNVNSTEAVAADRIAMLLKVNHHKTVNHPLATTMKNTMHNVE